MTSPPTSLILAAGLFFLALTPTTTQSSPTLVCVPTPKRDPHTLRHDQITVLINGFSESRIPLLQSLAATYSLSPLVSSVLILWGNPSTPPHVLHQLAQNLSSASITFHRQPSPSLNLRFLPRPNDIKTDAVLICDDDIELDARSFEFAFRIWSSSSNRNRIVGLFARSHDMDLNRREWVYTVHPDRYSMVLTKFMILSNEYLYKYSCEGGTQREKMREVVDSVRNCEDILMNFVVADESGVGPVLVGAKKVRDYGDARNEGVEEGRMSVGLSSRRGKHRKMRGWCIREFHRVMGRMPLRYSYGQVVDSVGEQGLCHKGGKLVFCDQ